MHGVGGENVRVLIADDAAIVRKVMVEMLEQAGHTVVGQAGAGEDAVRLYDDLRPDVAVLDVNMPGLDGIAAAEQIRLAHPTARVVLTSVYVNESRLERVHGLGSIDYVLKPFRGRTLVDAVERATGDQS
jgi:response regulator NasT